MATIEVKNTKKDTIVKTGERFLDVRAIITDGKKKIPRNFGFPIDTPAKEIKKELEKALEQYETEKAQAAVEVESTKVEDAADKTIEALDGLKISN